MKGNLYNKKIKRTPFKKKKSQEKIYKTNYSREISQTMSKETFTNKAPHKNVQTKISIKFKLLKQNFEEKISTEKMKRNHYQKIFAEKLARKISEK